MIFSSLPEKEVRIDYDFHFLNMKMLPKKKDMKRSTQTTNFFPFFSVKQSPSLFTT